jgi:hypothetical protein
VVLEVLGLSMGEKRTEIAQAHEAQGLYYYAILKLQ